MSDVLDNFSQTVPVDTVICKEGDLTKDLYVIVSGKLMVCSRNNTMVTPLAYLSDGDYFGEFSFFDNQARSADVIAVKETKLLKIPQAELKKQFPRWLILMSKCLTNKLRTFNGVVRSKGIKRKNVESIKPLSIEEQRHFYSIITGE
tara:strand:- start:65247 stop:65687 length:441 start_codon:yes stop_codon:yes gene_type:complete